MRTSTSPALTIVLACSLCATDTLADYVVLQSNSAQYPPGQIVSAPDELELADGTQLVLLSERGEAFNITGPVRHLPDKTEPAATDLHLMLTNLVSHTQDNHISLGGTRGGIDTNKANDTPVWSLNPFISGIQCVIEKMNVHLWRPETRSSLELTVNKAGSEDTGRIRWDEGEEEAQWPSDIPIADGQLYVIRREGWMQSSMIRLATLPEVSIDSKTSAVAWMAAKKCIPQAEKLMRLLE